VRSNNERSYVLVAATARTADAMRIYGGAEGKVPKADPDARREWAEMAQLCAGALPAPIDVDALTPVFWRLLRASIKVRSIVGLLRALLSRVWKTAD